MKVDPVILKYLLESMCEGVREMFQVLRAAPGPESLQVLARVAHKLKGEATVVGLNNLSQLICGLEDTIEKYQRLKKIDKTHFQVVALHLKKIVSTCEQIQCSAAGSIKAKSKASALTPTRGVAATLQVLAQNVSRSCGKHVTLSLDKFNLADIPAPLQMKVQDMIIQLVRNAITHGIESPEERRQRGKSPTGVISIAVQKKNNMMLLLVRDNGQGINLENIRRRLILENNHRVQEVAAMPDKVLLNSLFKAGFSTLFEQQQHAGRGVGLDLVRDHAESLGGKVEIQYREKEFTQFMVSFPLVKSVPIKKTNPAIPLLVNPVYSGIPLLRRKVKTVQAN